MFDDDAYMREREEFYQWSHKRNEEFLNSWCKEAGVDTPVGYYEDYANEEYIVYTDHPGYLIGRAGELVNKYTDIMKSQWRQLKRIKFVEIKGGFANYTH